MNAILRKSRFTLAMVTVVAGILAAGAGMAMAATTKVTLSGDQEVPPVSTSAQGSGTITVGADKSVSGSVNTSGVDGKAAHIHEGAPGANGPVIIPLKNTSANVWSVPAGAKLTDAQYKSYEAGNLYINVHSAAHKDGEIRGQLKP
ncbi:MAG: CHRD domain-containing protein [Sulfuricaulis sp.]|uniref:CHRD domain-containing protein n=1 Tax=Sulfuricaulis sp. TaxID=2003553 RepID=UPI003C33D6BC